MFINKNMPHSRSRSHKVSRRRSRSGAKYRRHSRRHSLSGSHSKSRRVSRHSRRHSRSGASSKSLVYVPRGISQGRAKRLVYDGVYQKTRGGLTKADLIENKYGKVVSARKAKAGKKLQRENPFKQNKKFMKYAGKVNKL
jgi:hypothetical protein